MEIIKPNNRIRLFLLTIIMVAAAATVAGISVRGLYTAAVSEQRARLIELAEDRARLIEAINAEHDELPPQQALAATLAPITQAHERYSGLGQTGEFTLAHRIGDQIQFLLSHRHFDLSMPKPVPWDAEIAEPMRRALAGHQGTIVALDYRGAEVLAAYEPVKLRGFDLGMVAKIDMAEIRAPFVKAIALTVLGGGLVIILSIGLFWRLGQRILDHERAETRFRELLFESAPDATLFVDEHGRIVLLNAQAERLFGYARSELLGRPVEVLIPDRFGAKHAGLRRQYFRRPSPRFMGQTKELYGLAKDGREFPVEISLSPVRTTGGNLVATAVRDVSDRRQAEATIERMALQDALTGLPNRRQFQERLQQAISQAKRSRRHVGLMLLDLDGFKFVNDTYGHAMGDALLTQVAARLTDCVRETDTVARLGGDEFAVISPNIDSPEAAMALAERLVKALARSFWIDGREVHSGTSIGITVFPHETGNTDQLLRFADLALYRAKDEGPGSFRLYDEVIDAEVKARRALEEDLRAAMKDEQLRLVYQPKFDIASGALIGAEALLRWTHPERGPVSPAEFIPVAESSGLIIPISEWVVRTVCEQNRAWQDAGLPRICLAVNVSPLQFKQPGFADQITASLQAAGLNPKWLELEITETMAMEGGEQIASILEALRWIGVGISIDDFGTGFSSLTRLKAFPVNRLKIDQSFVRDITTDLNDAAISSAIIQLGHSLKIKVIAEGVETQEQFQFLAEHGCDEAQGYHLSRPLEAEAFAAFLSSHEAAAFCRPAEPEDPWIDRRIA